ncbi:NAD(P)-binding protein [Penicillium cf. viridicatum]|uniref:NAD(P)-binding protein n=1 Tax=Penicillium cf. viridicatum TaxID=2972119 RepID=A0A9W9MVB8_9EURO|nr:NAD(P)-binding protein [Penicillium cf. viridicatum]
MTKEDSSPATQGPNTIIVDYRNIDSLVSIFEEHNINTVICAFAVKGDSLVTSQLNLIQAATKFKATIRFIPGGFAIPYPQRAVQILPQLKGYFTALDVLRESGLMWTIFHGGIFLFAAIPGDGNVPVTFTYSFDLARFVVAALDLEKWDEETRVVGDEITWNQFVALAERYRGSKFETCYDDVDMLKRFEITELPGHRALYDQFPKKPFQWFMSIFELFTTDGTSHIQKHGSLNDKFPEITPLSVEGMLNRFWGNHGSTTR